MLNPLDQMNTYQFFLQIPKNSNDSKQNFNNSCLALEDFYNSIKTNLRKIQLRQFKYPKLCVKIDKLILILHFKSSVTNGDQREDL